MKFSKWAVSEFIQEKAAQNGIQQGGREREHRSIRGEGM
jgi:hypothetical protein